MTDSESKKDKDNKKTKAMAIVKAKHDEMTTKELVSEIMTKVGMSQLGARTYVYDCRKALNLPAKAREKKAAKKTTTTTKPKKAAAAKTESSTKTPRKRTPSKSKAPKRDAAGGAAAARKADHIALLNGGE